MKLAANMAKPDEVEAIAGAGEASHQSSRGVEPARPFLMTLATDFAGSRQTIHIVCEPTLRLSAAQLAPLGRIATEAIANALKHAFPNDREGDVWVRLGEASGRITLVVRDNGVGMSDMSGGRQKGLGLIEALARQLGGYARLGSANFGGAEVAVVFPHDI